jgi:hypothetical protein
MGWNGRVRIPGLLPNIRVAQLDRATAYEAVGWGSNPSVDTNQSMNSVRIYRRGSNLYRSSMLVPTT